MPAIHFEASAPGKLILMGEHAAVYGRPAVVSALDLRTRAVVEPIDRAAPGDLTLELPDVGLRQRCSWDELRAYGDRRRELWRRNAERPDAAEPAAPEARDEAAVVKVAAAEAARALEAEGEWSEQPACRLSVTSRLPRGSGFGSSASVAVAVGAALLGSLSGEAALGAADPRIARVALEAEKRQHGRPSGVDHTAVIRGGFLAVRRESGSLESVELPRPGWLRGAIRLFDTGRPSESTGEVVAGVRRLGEREPAAFEELLDEMERSTRAFVAALHERAAPWTVLAEAVRSFEGCLERLEVVPAPVADAVRRIEAAGGAVKVSGAGALTGAAAGCLIVLWPPADGAGSRTEAALEAIVEAEGYRPLDARLGASGLKLRSGDDV